MQKTNLTGENAESIIVHILIYICLQFAFVLLYKSNCVYTLVAKF